MMQLTACTVAFAILTAGAAPSAARSEPVSTRPAVTSTRPATQPALLAHVDHRMELMSIIFRLAGNPEYNRAAKSPYSDAVEKHFAPFQNHPAVVLAAKLRNTRSVSFDAVADMAVHVTDAVRLRERVPFDHPNCKLDSRWGPKAAREFLERARSFVKDTGFENFMTGQEIYFTAAGIRMNELLTRRGYLDWFDSFFGPRENAQYEVIVGLLAGGSNYGCSVRLADGSEHISPVIGVWHIDRHGLPKFPHEVVPTLIHEFCHPYVNPVVHKYAHHMETAGRRLHATCVQTMRDQAYGTWDTVLCESVVRACVVRYVRTVEGLAPAQAEIRRQHERGFEWVGDLSKLLETYEHHRDQYPNLEAFMPRIVAFFDDYAKKAEAQAARRPKVVSMEPVNGATDVDPNLKQIRITFDRPMMDRSWSVVGGGPDFPEITGRTAYDRQRKVLTIPVRLKPGWSYQFWLNRGGYKAFRSAEGVPLESVPVSFSTSGDKN